MTKRRESQSVALKPTVQYRKPVKGSVIWWLRCLGVVAFLIVLLRLPRSQAVQLARIDLRWLGFCMLVTILQWLLEASMWHWLLSMQQIRYSYPKTVLSYMASQYLGVVTPGHVGEFLAAGYISMDTGITFGYALSSVVMKKMLTWVALISYGVWGLQIVGALPIMQGVRWIVLMSVVVLLVLSSGIALWVVSLRRLAKKWRTLSPWQIEMDEFWSGMRHLASPALVAPCGIALLAFSLLFIQVDAVLHALGVSLPLPLVAQIVALSRLVARVIPISVVGFGSKDAAVISLLSQHGVDPSIGLAATLLLLVCSYLVTLLLSGLCWWIKPLVIRRVESPRR